MAASPAKAVLPADDGNNLGSTFLEMAYAFSSAKSQSEILAMALRGPADHGQCVLVGASLVDARWRPASVPVIPGRAGTRPAPTIAAFAMPRFDMSVNKANAFNYLKVNSCQRGESTRPTDLLYEEGLKWQI